MFNESTTFNLYLHHQNVDFGFHIEFADWQAAILWSQQFVSAAISSESLTEAAELADDQQISTDLWAQILRVCNIQACFIISADLPYYIFYIHFLWSII